MMFGAVLFIALKAKRMIDPREEWFVKNFIIANKQMRWMEALTSPKRNRFLVRLADEKDFNPNYMTAIDHALRTAGQIAPILRSLGSGSTFRAISQWSELDARELELEEALELAVGIGLGSILVSNTLKLAYFEKELPGYRWLLIPPKKQPSIL